MLHVLRTSIITKKIRTLNLAVLLALHLRILHDRYGLLVVENVNLLR
jgi:hypothetical protein